MNGADSTQHGTLFSLQAARSNGKRVLSCGHGAKGPGSKQNYRCHLNIHALFQHPTIYSRQANKLYCAKKYQNRHFVLQAGIYIHLMRKNVLYKY